MPRGIVNVDLKHKLKAFQSSRRAKRTRILIADDNDHYSGVLALVLKAENMEVFKIVSTGREAVEATLNDDLDIILLDLAMPDIDGLAALATIKYLSPETKIIVITSSTDPNLKSRAKELGADVFINKSIDIHILLNSMRAMAFEASQIENAEDIIHFNGTGQLGYRPSEPNFTPQEIRILSCLAQGHTNATISDRISISANTIKSHMHNIFKKLGYTNRTQVAIWAKKNGFGERE